MPRIFHPEHLATGLSVALVEHAARHVQVLRMQPGDSVVLFNSQPPFGEFEATIERMGKRDVQVTVGAHVAHERESLTPVHIALGVPANERMDWLVEKATELGVASITPLLTSRTVVKLSGERADKRREHWQGIAVAACEQSGRNRVPVVAPLHSLADWLASLPVLAAAPASASRHSPLHDARRLLLSLSSGAPSLATQLALMAPPPTTLGNHSSGNKPRADATQAQGPRPLGALLFLSGPEGGFSNAEEAAALACGFSPTTLGPRILRAETAPLAVLAAIHHLERLP